LKIAFPSRAYRPSSAAMLLALVLGCSSGDQPPLGRVRGKVTLDGQPLAGATIMFMPQQGRRSRAITNSDGSYELSYTRDTKGAVAGSHTVMITTADEDEPGTERLPARYHSGLELKEQVASGKNNIDFDLKSE